ncbi:MAG: hypothetical protein HY275_04105 [Gemmatimonadetes bacterium]|nr:hypothetical protein [Gemmatimonadota bacterium]
MTLTNTFTVVGASTLDPYARAAFTQRLVALGGVLRRSATAAFAPSPEYAQRVVALAGRRQAELLGVLDGESVIARGLVAVSTSDPSTATLGLYEVVAGERAPLAAQLLAEAARAWAAQRGCTRLVAPVDLNSWFQYRTLTPPTGAAAADGPFFWEPVTPPAHTALLEATGFAVTERYHSLVTAYDPRALAHGLVMHADATERVRAARVTLSAVGSAPSDALLDEIGRLSNIAFAQNPLFEPLPLDLFRAQYRQMAARVDHGPSQLARDAHGHLVGFLFAFVDGPTACIKTAAVAADVRNAGLMSAMHHRAITNLIGRPLTTVAWAPFLEGNWTGRLARDYVRGPEVLRQRDYALWSSPCDAQALAGW